VDLLNHLARSDAARLWLSARSGMNIAPLRLAGIPMHPVAVAGRRLPRRAQDASLRAVQRLAFGDLGRYGYRRSDLGAFTRLAADGVTVAVDDGFVRALKSGRVTMKPGVARVEGRNVCFATARPAHPTSSSAPPATGLRSGPWSGTWWHWTNPACRRSPARRPRRTTPACGSSGSTAASMATCMSTGGRHDSSRR
jgi:hypothetical protein